MSLQNKKKQERWFSIIAVVGTLCFCLAVLEVGVRIFAPQSTLRQRDLFFQFDPLLGAEGIPDKKGVFATTQFSTIITHNSKGFRDYEHSEENRNGKLRVITLGDSFTWGHGVENNEIYVKKMETLSPRVETINMGGPGGDPPGELKVYLFRGSAYEHDIVLLGFYIGNDVVDTQATEESIPPQFGYDKAGNFTLMGKVLPPEEVRRIREESAQKYDPHKYRDLKGRINYWFIQHFQSYTLLDNLQDHFSDMLKGSTAYWKVMNALGLKVKRPMDFLQYCEKKDSEEIKRGWKITEGVLKSLKEYAQLNGAKPYILFIPHITQMSDAFFKQATRYLGYDPARFDSEKPNRKLAELCRKLDIAYLDLLPVMREKSAEGEKLYYEREYHWNKAGHQLAAEEVIKDFKRRGWLL